MEDALKMKKYTKPSMETLELRVQESLAGPLDWADPDSDIGGSVTLVAYDLMLGTLS